MLNQVILVGKIKEMPKCQKDQTIEMKVELEKLCGTNTVIIELWKGIAEVVSENYGVGWLVGIKGRILPNEDGYGKVVAERLSFIGPKDESAKEENGEN